MRILPSLVQSFRRRDEGLAAAEFALVLPFLMILLFGSAGIFDYVQAKNRTQTAADAIADLVSRTTEMDDDEFDDVMRAAKLVLGKYASQMTVKAAVTAYVFDEDDDEWQVEWTEGYNQSSPHSKGDSVDADDFPRNHSKDMVILVELDTSYRNALFYLDKDGVDMSKRTVRLPRYVSSIEWVD